MEVIQENIQYNYGIELFYTCTLIVYVDSCKITEASCTCTYMYVHVRGGHTVVHGTWD